MDILVPGSGALTYTTRPASSWTGHITKNPQYSRCCPVQVPIDEENTWSVVDKRANTLAVSRPQSAAKRGPLLIGEPSEGPLPRPLLSFFDD